MLRVLGGGGQPTGTRLARQLVHKYGCFKLVQLFLSPHDSDPPTSTGAQMAAADGDAFASQAWISRVASPVVADLAGARAGPLAGLMFAVKDNIDAAGLPTTAACPAFAYTPPANAVVVQALLDAGASLLGKTSLDQFAGGLNGTRSPFGAVPNAFNPAYVSGGSSAGSAYVVATGQADFALGTDTAGSGRVPAGLNNIVYPLKLEGKSEAEVDRRMAELVASFDVKFDLKRDPYELSGGQQQTASIMRALAPNPEVLFLDEPFSALDFEMTLFIREKLQEVFMQTGTTMLLVSHDLEEAVHLADEVLLLTKRPTRVAEILPYGDTRPRTVDTLSEAGFISTKKRSLEIFQREVRR